MEKFEIYKKEYINKKLKKFDNVEDNYQFDKEIIHYFTQHFTFEFFNEYFQKSPEEFIEDNISTHVFLALSYLSRNHELNVSFVYNCLIKGLDYFKSFRPNRLSMMYMLILHNYKFDEEQIKTLLVKMFHYLLHSKLMPDVFITRALNNFNNVKDLRIKFIIWYLSKEINDIKTSKLFLDLLKQYHHLNKYEMKMIEKYGINYFLNTFKHISDEQCNKSIYNLLVKLFPEQEGKIKLGLLSLTL